MVTTRIAQLSLSSSAATTASTCLSFLLVPPTSYSHLDKGIFGPLGREHSEELEYHNRWNELWMDTATFL